MPTVLNYMDISSSKRDFNGKKLSTSVKSWHGHHTSPLATNELMFRDASTGILDNRRIAQTIDLVLGLEKLMSISKLTNIINFPEA